MSVLKMFNDVFLDSFQKEFEEICAFARINERVKKFLIQKMNHEHEEHLGEWRKPTFDLNLEIQNEFADLCNYFFLKYCKGELSLEQAKIWILKILVLWTEFFFSLNNHFQKEEPRRQRCEGDTCTL